MKTVIELALKRPFELRVGEITRVKFEVVGVHGNGRILEADYDLYRLTFDAGIECEQWMFVEAKVLKDALEVLL